MTQLLPANYSRLAAAHLLLSLLSPVHVLVLEVLGIVVKRATLHGVLDCHVLRLCLWGESSSLVDEGHLAVWDFGAHLPGRVALVLLVLETVLGDIFRNVGVVSGENTSLLLLQLCLRQLKLSKWGCEGIGCCVLI